MSNEFQTTDPGHLVIEATTGEQLQKKLNKARGYGYVAISAGCSVYVPYGSTPTKLWWAVMGPKS